ncbi:sodium:calcium antiporter [Nonomuraea sp. PA05]|uniref:sodium:calcium antiporter n=1 Tax=Nonomuraea sp. PA05 TaxID=2604466 RepID=UPI0011DBB669|nr:sodium:calcium antiporter [Nonomuraea sp. PA05]TYB57021.1 sodium:calcium antiporter [Nonomuraea sp. PA05]
MLLLLTLSALGLAVLAVAADHLVIGSGRLAERLGLQPVVVGVVVIGFGTSAPELLVTGTASLRGQSDLALAGLVGSNIVNLTLILGLAGLAATLAVRSSVLRREAPLSVAAVTLFAVAALSGLGPGTGVVLVVALAGSMVLLLRFARQAPRDPVAAETADYLRTSARPRLTAEVPRTLLGLAGTLLGAQLLVVNASELAIQAGLSAELVGFTLVALGTSLPELVTSLQAQRRGDSDLVVGNLLGSNLINSLAGGTIIAFAGTTAPAMAPAVIAAMAGVSGLTWALLARGKRLSRAESALLLVAYVALLPLVT